MINPFVSTTVYYFSLSIIEVVVSTLYYTKQLCILFLPGISTIYHTKQLCILFLSVVSNLFLYKATLYIPAFDQQDRRYTKPLCTSFLPTILSKATLYQLFFSYINFIQSHSVLRSFIPVLYYTSCSIWSNFVFPLTNFLTLYKAAYIKFLVSHHAI